MIITIPRALQAFQSTPPCGGRLLEALESGGGSAVYNLGNEQGHSVREVIDVARRVTGVELVL